MLLSITLIVLYLVLTLFEHFSAIREGGVNHIPAAITHQPLLSSRYIMIV